MKLALSIAAILFSSVCLAQGPLSNGVPDYVTCPLKTILEDGYRLECRGAEDFAKIKGALVGENVPDLRTVDIELDWFGAVELGVLPDADTSMVYGYNRKLVNRRSGTLIGIISIEGYVNSEMEERVKLVSRYNKLGKLVSVTVQDY